MLAMVRFLLKGGLVGAACLATGCFAPQEIEPIEDPPVFNEPPVIDIRKVTPSDFEVCMSALDEPGERLNLSATVEDPNGVDGQVLEARWFVDYEFDVSETTGPRLIQFPLSPQKLGDSVSYPQVTMTWDYLRSLRLSEGVHYVEVVVSDGFSTNQAAEPRNRTTKTEPCGTFTGDCYLASHVWAVQVRETTPCE